ncbi:unnamed protein product, partial [Tetraodon nigroviridis]
MEREAGSPCYESLQKRMETQTPGRGDEGQADTSFSDSSLFAHWGQNLSPDNRRVALKMFQYYGYNGYLSDRLPLDRPIPDLRPDGCRNTTYPLSLPQVSIVFIFVNEALSVILRSIHSAINRTPSHLLKEIILVDDNSSNRLNPSCREFKKTEPASFSPSFDNIKYDTFEIEEYPLSAQGFDWELWCRYLNPPKSWWFKGNKSAPIQSPALIGCFVVDRLYFEEIGLLDEGMEVYGGENVELGIRDSGIDIGDVSDRKALRKRLQCKTFRWYLVNMYPEMRMYSDTVAYGSGQISPIMQLRRQNRTVYYTSAQQIHIGLLSPTVDDDDNKCLVDVNSRLRLIECSYAAAKRMKLHWLFTQGGPIQNRKSKRCLELIASSDNEFGYQLALQKCTGQKWFITNVLF